MSLLFQNPDEKLNNIARKVFERHFERDPRLLVEYDERRKLLMYEDILYNMSYLDTAMRLDDGRVFTDYAVWIYHLMCHLMRDLDKTRIKDQMILHYKILGEVLNENLSGEDAHKAGLHLEHAMAATEYESGHFAKSVRFETGEFVEIRKEYLGFLFANDTKGAIGVIARAASAGIELEDIYLQILQEVMYEVGDLWHQNAITVDKEHYCTSTTQVALSQFYPVIFSKPRNGCKILTCCVGSELHEMGIRMVSDLFEYHGWDSIYLGAAVPKQAILHAIGENKPDLVGLSVTMPQHLPLCLEIARGIREKYKDVKIAVGGRAFQSTDQLWKKWDVDVYKENAAQMVEWATRNIARPARVL